MSILGDIAGAFGIDTTKGAGGIISSLLKGGAASSLASGLGGVAQAKAQNRGAKLNAMMAQDQMQMAEQAQRNADLPNIINQLRAANYVANGGNPNIGKPITLPSGHTITPINYSMPISDADKQAAQTEITQLNNRLNKPPTYNNYSSVMNPSGTETALNWITPFLSASGAASQQKQNQGLIDVLMNSLKPTNTAVAPTTTVGQVTDDGR